MNEVRECPWGTKKLVKVTIENEWLVGKLRSLDSSNKKALVESKQATLSITRQCVLLGLNRSNLYYKSTVKHNEIAIKKQIESIFEEIPSYGYLKVHQQLLEDGYRVSPNTVQKYRQELGLRAVLAVKAPYTIKGNKQHPIYSYKLKGVDITRSNQV